MMMLPLFVNNPNKFKADLREKSQTIRETIWLNAPLQKARWTHQLLAADGLSCFLLLFTFLAVQHRHDPP
jgi:hypothetical protein